MTKLGELEPTLVVQGTKTLVLKGLGIGQSTIDPVTLTRNLTHDVVRWHTQISSNFIHCRPLLLPIVWGLPDGLLTPENVLVNQ